MIVLLLLLDLSARETKFIAGGEEKLSTLKQSRKFLRTFIKTFANFLNELNLDIHTQLVSIVCTKVFGVKKLFVST